MTRPGRSEAAAANWDWRHPTDASAAKHSVWPRAAVQTAVGGGVALLLAWWGRPLLAAIVGTIAAAGLAAALLSPRGLYARLEQGMARLAHGVGSALTWTLMVIVFYLVFLPFGLLFRRGRRDSMRRFFEPESPSYWKRREPERDALRSHERPF